MRKYHMATIPACVALIMVMIHLFVGWMPVYQNHQEAEQMKEQLLVDRERGVARVAVLYDYADEPNMGSSHGADVIMLTPDRLPGPSDARPEDGGTSCDVPPSSGTIVELKSRFGKNHEFGISIS